MTFLAKIKEFFFGPSEQVPVFNTIATSEVAAPVVSKAPTLEVVVTKPKKKKAKAVTQTIAADPAPKKTRAKKSPELRVEK